jgi:anti-sigma factor RsiW
MFAHFPRKNFAMGASSSKKARRARLEQEAQERRERQLKLKAEKEAQNAENAQREWEKRAAPLAVVIQAAARGYLARMESDRIQKVSCVGGPPLVVPRC